jgi:SAM-dependent methyltransferase
VSEGWPRPEGLTDEGWWQQERLEYLRELLAALPTRPSAILDAGCGTGFGARTLVSGPQRVGLDAYVYDEWYGGSDVRFVQGDMATMPFASRSFDLVMALDAIEHYPDDRAVVREICRVCRPGGNVLIAVPALQALWSSWDEDYGHYRRYSRRSLSTLCAGVGLEVVRMTYIFGWLAPLAFVLRRSSLRASNAAERGATSALAHALCTAERFVTRRMPLPVGTSLVALCTPRSAEG